MLIEMIQGIACLSLDYDPVHASDFQKEETAMLWVGSQGLDQHRAPADDQDAWLTELIN